MRPVIKHYVETVLKTLPPKGPVYEFGSMEIATPTFQGATNFRELVTGMGVEYVGCDMRPGQGVDSLQNLHALDLADGSVGTVICVDTIEHVEYPRQAISEIHRVLASPGMAIVTSVMNFLIHGYPEDYWRFTPKGLESLLKSFDVAIVDFSGKDDFPRNIVSVAFKGEVPDLTELKANIALWKERENHRSELIAKKEILDLCKQYFPDKF